MYGRQPENIEIINQIFHTILGNYPADKVTKSFEKWMERSQEFPTPSDIVNLIKRNGKPPLSKEIYVTISKKDPEFRNSDDWHYLREYEEQQQDDFGSDFVDTHKYEDFTKENNNLRKEISELKSENKRLAELLHEERISKVIEKPKPSLEEKITNTVLYLQQNGASQSDIDSFMETMKAA